MATEQPKPATEEAKMDLFEDDDEFEEFEIDYGGRTFMFMIQLQLMAAPGPWTDRPSHSLSSYPCLYFSLATNRAIPSLDSEDKEEGKEALQQWEDDWDDDDLNDDFSLQLRRELEGNSEKNEAKST